LRHRRVGCDHELQPCERPAGVTELGSGIGIGRGEKQMAGLTRAERRMRSEVEQIAYRRLWKTKRFKVFVHYLMDETFLLKKLVMIEAITTVPPKVSSAIKRINEVRNALAHSLFPENRRRYMVDKKVTYRGVDLFTVVGVEKFQEDYEIVRQYLAKKVFG